MGRPKKQADLDSAIAAYLLATSTKPDRLKSQAEIAAHMNISEVTLSRLLKRAREAGYLQLKFVEKDITRKAVMDAIAGRKQIHSVVTTIQRFADEKHPGRLKGVYIYETPKKYDTKTAAGWMESLRQLAEESSSLTKDLLLSVQVIGISWGRTLHHVVSALERMSGDPWRDKKKTKVIPLWGEIHCRPPRGHPSHIEILPEMSSTRLAERLANVIEGDSEYAWSLAGVPALVHRRHEAADLKIIKSSFMDNDFYREVFGDQSRLRGERGGRDGQTALAARMDAALVAVGSSNDRRELFWNSIMAEHSGFDIDQLQRATYGDIGGVLLQRPEVKNARSILAAPRSHWTGVRERHLRKCARDAEKSKSPGVIVYASGAIRHEILKVVLTCGLANHLIIDSTLGDALAESLG